MTHSDQQCAPARACKAMADFGRRLSFHERNKPSALLRKPVAMEFSAGGCR